MNLFTTSRECFRVVVNFSRLVANIFMTSRIFSRQGANFFHVESQIFRNLSWNYSQPVVKFFTTGHEFFYDRSWIFSRLVVNFLATGCEFFHDWSRIFSPLVMNIFFFSLGSMNPHAHASVHVHSDPNQLGPTTNSDHASLGHDFNGLSPSWSGTELVVGTSWRGSELT